MRHHLFARLFCSLSLALIAPTAHSQLVKLPAPPTLTDAGRSLIYEFETGGKAQYLRHPHPEWPGGASGVTWGIGYDATAQAESVIRSDWSALGLQPASRLAATHPYSGAAARAHLRDVREITVSWELSTNVFERVDVTRADALCRRAFPGFEALKPNARAALLSLVFNRGASMAGPARAEMRAIRDLVPREDYRGIARQLRLMERVWRGKDIEAGMIRRREAEARLVESCL